MQYILNESTQSDKLGDLSVYPNLPTLLLNVEPIDVENHEYFVYDADGYHIDLSLDDETDVIHSHGRTGQRDLNALDLMLREQVELLRAIHPQCVGKQPDELAQMSGPELTEYILHIYINFEIKWKRSRPFSRLGRRLLWFIKHKRKH